MSDAYSILIVDSNEAFSTLLREALEQNVQCRAVAVADGNEALQALAVAEFDLAIVDMGLTNPDGPELARLLREQQGNLRLMVIPLIGEQLAPDQVIVDVQGILPKPFFLPELPNRVGDALAQTVGGFDAKEDQPRSALAEQEADPKDAIDSEPDEMATQTAPGEVTTNTAPDEVTTQPAPTKTPVTSRVIAPTTAAHRLIRLRNRFAEITQRMTLLTQEADAEAVLLTSGDKLISRAGRISSEDASGLARAIAVMWHASARVARILGRAQVHLEQSMEGDAHLLYSLTVTDDIVLSTAVLSNVPLGMVRHRARLAVHDLRAMIEEE